MVDIAVTAANVAQSTGANIKSGTTGAAVTAGQSLYIDTANSNVLKLADADDTALTATVCGIAINTAASGQIVNYQSQGTINPGGTAVVGTIYVASGTAGGIAPSTDLASSDYTTIIGVGTASNAIALRILVSGVQVP